MNQDHLLTDIIRDGYEQNGTEKMEFENCIKFANENKVCSIATIDDDKPRVRGFLMWFADKTGFYFSTGATKNVSKQLKKNPNVEMCIISQSPQGGKMMRVSGKARFIHDIDLKTRLLEELPFLKMFCKGPDDELLEVFQIYTGEAHFWTVENNLRESDIERISF